MDNALVIYYAKVRPDEEVFLPTRRADDSDYDIYTSIDIVIRPGETVPINTNLALELPVGWEGKLEEKSGLSLRYLSIHGGVIDHMYTGELIIVAHNRGHENISFVKGNKIAQMKIREQSPYFKFIEAGRPLKATVRGDKGFGSQGA